MNVTQIVAQEGLVGLQKLEANGNILPNFASRVGNIHRRSVQEAQTSMQIAIGIGRHSDLDKVLEMME
jgi:hypothetical protein